MKQKTRFLVYYSGANTAKETLRTIIFQSVWSGNKRFFASERFHSFSVLNSYICVCVPGVWTHNHRKNINQSFVICICNACQRAKRKLTFISYSPYTYLLFFSVITCCLPRNSEGEKINSPLRHCKLKVRMRKLWGDKNVHCVLP